MIRALLFDVFGTVVDWRGGVIAAGQALGRADLDWAELADAWRARYQPSMEEVRSGARPWTRLDDLHRRSLEQLLAERGVALPAEAVADLVRAWHRLDPWPDVVPALVRLRPRFILATLSNGNVSLLVDMARRAGLPWDAILGAEVARCYKPQPAAYLTTADLLGLLPAECLMVAAHNNDLHAAAGLGFRTAFVFRRTEHGPGQTTNLAPERAWDFVAEDLADLADQLGGAP